MKKWMLVLALTVTAVAQPILNLEGRRGTLQVDNDAQGRPHVQLRSHRQASPDQGQMLRMEDGPGQVVVEPGRSGVTRITGSRGTIVVPNELIKSLLAREGYDVRFSQP